MLESRAQRVHLSDLEWPFTKIISRLLPALGLAAHSRDLSSCLPMETAGQPTDPNLGIRFLEASLAQLPCAPQHAYRLGPPLVVQWLGLCLPIQGVWVRSLVRRLGPPHAPCPPPKKHKRSNVVTNSMKNLKMAHINLLKKHAYRVISHVCFCCALWPFT